MSIDLKAEIEAGESLLKSLPGVLQFGLIGSAMYMPEPNDVDFLVLLAPDQDAVDYTTSMQHSGWGVCGEYDGEDGIWGAVRKDRLNLIVTHDEGFFSRYMAGMQVCKALKLEHREDRVAVCQIVRDGYTADQVLTFAKKQEAMKDLAGVLDEELQ